MKSRKISVLLGRPLATDQEQNCPELCLPKTKLGLEFEWEDTGRFHNMTATLGKVSNVHEFNRYFSQHSDGSLRNAGTEFVFNGPMCGTRVLKALDLMDDMARACAFAASYRTSLHVHMDVGELSIPEDLDSIVILYCIFEYLIYKFIGNNRESSNYCIPWYMNPQHFQVYKKILKGYGNSGDETLVATLKNSKPYKYSGLNMFSLGDFGTLEFRHAPVNMQKAKILTWLNILLRMKKWVMENGRFKGEDIFAHLEKQGPLHFAQEVFQEQYKDLVKYSRMPQTDIREGLNTAYHYLATV